MFEKERSNIMDKRLPYNEKEGLIYGGIIALITVIVMLFLNIGT